MSMVSLLPPAPPSAFPAPGIVRIEFPQMSEDEFFAFCHANRDLLFEREANGNILLMSPVGNIGSLHEATLLGLLHIWNLQGKSGKLFSSAVGFTLPSGAVRSPDASWIRLDRWQSMSATDRRKFGHIAPDFVAEIRSESDSLPMLLAKLDEYIANGVRLAWLIDPIDRQAYVYRPGQPAQQVDFTATLSGEQVLEGFTLVLAEFDEAHL